VEMWHEGDRFEKWLRIDGKSREREMISVDSQTALCLDLNI